MRTYAWTLMLCGISLVGCTSTVDPQEGGRHALDASDAGAGAAFTSPVSGARLGGKVSVSANVTSASRVEFYAEQALIGTATAAPWTLTWDTAQVPNGSHALTAKVFLQDGTPGPVLSALPVTVTNSVPGHALQTVFIIMMENHNWSSISGSSSAPYINQHLLVDGAHAEQYFNPPGLHPSEPNYFWLEAGTNFGVKDDKAPSVNHQSTPQHLVTMLQTMGVSWKSYQEGITGTDCPLVNQGLYAPKHNPMVYFDDVTDSQSATSANCIAHVRPYGELATDLQQSTVPQYVFITPDLCNDMHNASGCATGDAVSNGDSWLAREVPKILASATYQNNGALFILWDESEGGDLPIGMMVQSPLAKRGYANSLPYSHSSMLRTTQEIFGATPLLGDAANATDLADLFQQFP